MLDLVNGAAYRPVPSKFPIFLLLPFSILANGTSPTFRVADLEIPLLGLICLLAETRCGNEGPADSFVSSIELPCSVRSLSLSGESKFPVILFETIYCIESFVNISRRLKEKTDLVVREQIGTVEPLVGNEQIYLRQIGPKIVEYISYLWPYFGRSLEIEKSWTR